MVRDPGGTVKATQAWLLSKAAGGWQGERSRTPTEVFASGGSHGSSLSFRAWKDVPEQWLKP